MTQRAGRDVGSNKGAALASQQRMVAVGGGWGEEKCVTLDACGVGIRYDEIRVDAFLSGARLVRMLAHFLQ